MLRKFPNYPATKTSMKSPEDSGPPGGPLPDDGFLRGAPPRGPPAPEVPGGALPAGALPRPELPDGALPE
eukprot:4780525-Alexandrium_andersonii.AAC.1